jgi:hypothetical protein
LTLCDFSQKLSHRIESLEQKQGSAEEVLIAKTAHRLSTMLNYDQKFMQLEQQIQLIVGTVEASVLEKVTDLITENMDDLVPDLPDMKTKLEKMEKDFVDNEIEIKKIGTIAAGGRQGVEELKNEFEYMKTRFSP